MQTVSEFKRRLIPGTKVKGLLLNNHNGEWIAVRDYGIREVSIVQSNSFALKTVVPDGSTQNSWCSYPKKTEFKGIDSNTVEITEGSIKLIYTFL